MQLSTTGARTARPAGSGSATLLCGQNTDEAKWLAWLDIAKTQLEQIQRLKQIANEVMSAGFKHALHPSHL
jgi:hypothetical protein